MNKDEFVEAVQRRSTIGSSEEAERSIQETLEVLTEHLGSDRAKDLAAQLPSGIGQYLSHERGEDGKALVAARVRPTTRRGGASRIGPARSRRVSGRAKLNVYLSKESTY
jgi:uncharacterized protein (DUF2267 family)